MKRVLPFILLTLSAAAPSRGQLPDSLSDAGRIYVVTTLPGDRVHNRYGHTAIRVFDRYLGYDVVFNYGTFDFGAPGFLWKFAHGRMDYMLDLGSTRRAAQTAELEERLMRQQLLDINKEQRDALYSALLVNARPENREYRYDFLFDNCATRPLDMIAAALGGSVEWDSTTATGQTFRQLLDPYHADAPALDLGTDLVMGSGIDRIATAREEAFLPLRLEEILAAAWVEDQYGRRPLVLVQDTLIWSARPEMPDPAFPWPTALTGLVLLLGLASLRSRTAPGLLDRTLMIVLGLTGVVLLYMQFFTEHHVTDYNLNVLWALPTHLVAVFLMGRKGAGHYLMASSGLAVLSLLTSFVFQPVPSAAVPLILLVAIRFGVLGHRMTTSQ